MSTIKKIFRYISSLNIYKNIPIYNINWIKKKSFFKSILQNLEINFVDVGARGNSSEELNCLANHINFIGFDADKNEIHRLNKLDSKYKKKKYISAFLGSTKEDIEFLLYKKQESSSIYKLNKTFLKWFQPEDNYIEKKIKIQSDTMDNLINKDIDIIKLDTQGNEFEILQGATKSIQKALIVEIEVEFYQIYEKQKLAFDIMKKMHDNEFEILYINRVFSSSKKFKGISKGQITFGEILFGISREKAIKLSIEKQLKYCVLLINYGHIDFAFDIFENNKELKQKYPQLNSYFESVNKEGSKLKKFIKFSVDKIIFLLLFFRKTNGLKSDSDRSWPIR
jgi:FkbM family methyltransferase